MNTELKNEYIKTICDIFTRTEITVDKEIINYRVDLYFEELGLIVEFGEKELNNKREEEIIKYLADQAEIEDKIQLMNRDKDFDYTQWFGIVRIKEGEFGQGLRELFLFIQELTLNSPCDYM